MKITIVALLMLFFSINNCSNQEITSVESFNYETTTRGSSAIYTVTPEMVTVKRSGMNISEKSGKISKDEWNSLLEKASAIDASKMSEFEAPSDSRATDAALIATLSMRKNDTVYETNTFDHGNPPMMVKPLVEAILRLAENVE